MSGFGQRVLTAAVLIPLVAWAVLALPSAYLAAVFALVVLGGAWEWAALVGWRAPWARALYAVSFVPLLYLAYQALAAPAAGLAVLAAGLVWWALALVMVLRYEAGAEVRWLAPPAARAAGGWLALLPAWLGVMSLHAAVPWLALFLLALVWIADSGAYLVGRAWGSRRLAPRVSPGKTWEGALGGLAAVGLAALGPGAVTASDLGALAFFVLVCLAAALVSILGDLVESLLKRQAGVKDSGALVPGHGGVLDRIDSLLAAAPAFALGVHWLLR